MLWWLLPVLLGASVGLLMRWRLRRRIAHRAAAWLALALVPPLGAWLAVLSTRLGPMDGAAMALVAVLAWLAVAHGRFARPVPWLLSLVSLVLALLILEGAVRWGRPPPVLEQAPLSLLAPPSLRPDGLPVAAGDQLIDCALHADIGETTARCLRLGAPPRDRPWLLHLGDSMVFGSGVAPDVALPAQLQRLIPQFAHVNGGVPGSSVDVELALLQRLLTVAKPSLVVLYAMPGNDADEVGTPVESCKAEPPLQLIDGTAHLRCPKPSWAPRPWHRAFLYSRLPLPIAALTDVSWLARHLESLHRLALEPARAHEQRPPGDAAMYGQYVRALAQLLETEHVPLQIVVMPLRRSTYGTFTDARREQLRTALASAASTVLDSQPVLDAAVQREGEAAVYLDQPQGDIHLNPHGLSLLATWLAPQLALPQPVTPTL